MPKGTIVDRFDRLRRSLDNVTRRHGEGLFDLNFLVEERDCGSVCCVVGDALSDPELNPNDRFVWDERYRLIRDKKDGGLMDYSEAGTFMFDVTWLESITLFGGVFKEPPNQHFRIYRERLTAYFEKHGQTL